MEDDDENKGKLVCVTGGTGFVASWLIMRLLQHGCTVNIYYYQAFQSSSACSSSKKDISFLTDLPGAPERLRVFHADLDSPDSFEAPLEGCIGVFHVAHLMEFDHKETEEMITNRSVRATLGILQACLDSKTVKRVVYTSSASTVILNEKGVDVLDEEAWTDVDYVRNLLDFPGTSYSVSKTVTEKAALEFAEKNDLDLVTVISSWIHGPFICPSLPGSVNSSLAMFKLFEGNEKQFKYHEKTPFVHTDDAVSAHIFLFEYPKAKGRYICSALEITVDKLHEFLSGRYPNYQLLSPDSVTDTVAKREGLSSKKLLDTGFKYKYGLEEMFDDAIECCKKKGLL